MGSYKAPDARDGELGACVPLFLIAMKKMAVSCLGVLSSFLEFPGIRLMESTEGERERERKVARSWL